MVFARYRDTPPSSGRLPATLHTNGWKKNIFLEKIDYSDFDKNKEEEADNFAIKWALTKEEEQEIIDSAPLTEADIKSFAKKFNTHPAIIIGRLQHDELIQYG